MQPHRRQPTRLHRPWDSPGKNTGVGCHFLLQCMKGKSESAVALVESDSSRPHGLQPTRLLRPWDFPGKSTGVGCHCLLRGIFPTQGLNPGLPHCRQTLYHLSHQGGPWIERLIKNSVEELGFRGTQFCCITLFSAPCFSVSSHDLLFTSVTGLGPTQIQYDLILTVTPTKTQLPHKVTF